MLRTRRFAGIGFRGEDAARRPWVIGSGLDVWEIIQMLEDFGSIESLAEQTQLSERQVRLASADRDRLPAEIAEAIAENRRTAEQWRELYPFVRSRLRHRHPCGRCSTRISPLAASPRSCAAIPGAMARNHSRAL